MQQPIGTYIHFGIVEPATQRMFELPRCDYIISVKFLKIYRDVVFTLRHGNLILAGQIPIFPLRGIDFGALAFAVAPRWQPLMLEVNNMRPTSIECTVVVVSAYEQTVYK